MSTTTKKPAGKKSALHDVVAREYTIHLHKRVRQSPEGQVLEDGSVLIRSLAPRRLIQEAGTTSNQGDQGVRHQVNGTRNNTEDDPVQKMGQGRVGLGLELTWDLLLSRERPMSVLTPN
jgi:hypothetical protein